MGYRLMFLVSQLTAELWNACMSITFSGMGYEMVNQIIVVENVHHAKLILEFRIAVFTVFYCANSTQA